MVNQTLKIVIGAVVLLFLYTLGMRFFTPDFLVQKVEVEVEKEVTIDSSRVYQEYLETIPEEDRTIVKRDTIPVPVPMTVDSVTERYELSYSDSSITSTTTVDISNNAISNWKYEYILKRRVVRDQQTTIKQTINTTIRETTTLVRNPKPYFTVGAEITNLNMLSVGGGFMTSKRYHFYYRYNLELKTHSVGISIPLRFNIKSLL